MGLREEKKAELRRQLFTTAMALFREQGFEDTRVQDIVERVRVSEATFFNYFPTKEAVLQEAASETKDLYTVFLHHLLSRRDEPVADRLQELVGTIGATFAADQEFMSAVATQTSLFYGSTGDAAVKDHENFDLLAALFRQGQDSGEVRNELDALQLAEMLTAVYMLTITNWLTAWWGERGDLEKRLTSVVDAFFEGCRNRDG
ncbi:MAG: TetR/AcrR family transcriptional regulator [Acidimicrobiales bacterium]